MILYIVRHAWAVDRDDPAFPADAQRPLTDDGRKRFAKMARILADRGLQPQIVATSPLVRCRQTAEVLSKSVPGRPPVVDLDALAPDSDLEAALAWTRREAQGRDEVAWVGHAPDVGNLTAALTGDALGAIRFAKGGVAAIEFDGPPEVGRGELRWLVTAKLLGV